MKIIQVGKNHDAITKEVDLLKSVNHKNTVRYYGSCVHSDEVWVLMDFCGGGSVRDLLDVSVVPEKAAIWILGSLIEGISYLHSIHIIHRDIKSAKYVLDSIKTHVSAFCSQKMPRSKSPTLVFQNDLPRRFPRGFVYS